MDYSIIENIGLLDLNRHFELFSSVSKLINSPNTSDQKLGRKALIRILDVWDSIPSEKKTMWEDLIEATGFYPYINKYKINLNDLGSKIRKIYHTSEHLGKSFHKKQKDLSELLFEKRNVIASAPTSFGKSLLIEEIVASGLYKNIVIIQPTLALLDETRRKLKKYNNQYKLIVRTSQPYQEQGCNIFLLTAERVLEYQNLPSIDLLILDEFYKLSKRRGDNRANVLNIAFIRLMKNKNCRFYLLGPNIDDISQGFKEKYNAIFFTTDYTLVETNVEDLYKNVKTKKGGKVVHKDIFDVLDNIKGQTLIFCSSPATARKLAFEYCTHLLEKGINHNNNLPLIEWIAENLTIKWSLSNCLSNRIGIHDGSMPKHITTSTINYFNKKHLDFLFCTNTIIEGVNTSAKNVIYYDNKIGRHEVDYFDYSNILGRAGRLMEHCIGTIVNLKKPPDKERMIVDIPAFEQDPIDYEVLINHDAQDVLDKNNNKQRYENFTQLDGKLQDILKINAVSIQDQLDTLEILKRDLNTPGKRDLIIWNSLSASRNLYARLQYIFELCSGKFQAKNEEPYCVTIGWMVNKVVSYCMNHSVDIMIRERIEYKCKEFMKNQNGAYSSVEDCLAKYTFKIQKIIDDAIELIFKFQKNWLQYRIPKWLGIINSLQQYATKQMGLESGDYSHVADMIENEFAESNIRILAEYGIPSSAIDKIQSNFKLQLKDKPEDDVIKFINENRNEINKVLSRYEVESLDRGI